MATSEPDPREILARYGYNPDRPVTRDDPIPDRMIQKFARSDPDHREGRRSHDLSPRELDVLRYFSHGLTLDMVGETLGIDAETVRSYARHARMKLGAKNRVHACCLALRGALID